MKTKFFGHNLAYTPRFCGGPDSVQKGAQKLFEITNVRQIEIS